MIVLCYFDFISFFMLWYEWNTFSTCHRPIYHDIGFDIYCIGSAVVVIMCLWMVWTSSNWSHEVHGDMQNTYPFKYIYVDPPFLCNPTWTWLFKTSQPELHYLFSSFSSKQEEDSWELCLITFLYMDSCWLFNLDIKHYQGY